MDLGAPIAFTALAEGTPVFGPDGRRVGVVDQVLVEPPGGIFEGVIVHTLPLPGRHLRATPDQIAEIREHGVRLAVDREALREEPDRPRRRDGGPAPEPRLERLARRLLDRMRAFRG